MTIAPKYHTVPIMMMNVGELSRFIRDLHATREVVERQMRECATQHSVFLAYRRYRRGRNRCKWCGCKVENR